MKLLPLQVELGQMVLKRFLLLAMLLDRAMLSRNLSPKVPLLFRRGASVKSSEQVKLSLLQRAMLFID